MSAGTIRIGTSGWHYAHWLGRFYPEDMPPEAFLTWYADRLSTVEVNATYYRTPQPATIAHWRESVPEGFVFACKASRFITHMKKLNITRPSMARFFDTVDAFGDSLDPILFQLPPHWHADEGRLAAFLEELPSGLRYAFEFRDESWFAPPIYRLLERHGAALCVYDLDGWRSPVQVTSGFVYVRLHGPDGPYRGGYDGRALSGWARRFLTWSNAGLDVYCYFNNDDRAHAALDAQRLVEMVDRRADGRRPQRRRSDAPQRRPVREDRHEQR